MQDHSRAIPDLGRIADETRRGKHMRSDSVKSADPIGGGCACTGCIPALPQAWWN